MLFIQADDLCTRLECYGYPVKTPNIDRLAQRGVRFERAYCQFPLCSPSRTSVMTGLAPDTVRVWDLRTHFRTTVPDAVTLPQAFRANGYFAGRSGKIYHYNVPSEIGTPGFDDAASWDATANPAGVDRLYDQSLVTHLVPGGGRGAAPQKVDPLQTPRRPAVRISQDGKTPILPFGPYGDLGIAVACHPSEFPDRHQTDYLVADAAIQMIEQQRTVPWFIGAGFYSPHVPWIVPSKYFDLYPLDQIEIPPFDPAELGIAPRVAYSGGPANNAMSEEQHRQAIRAYYAATSFMDSQVGRLLDAIERLGLAASTTIVFWGDNGYQLGEHGQWQKSCLFEPSVRVPLIFAGAGVASRGKACARTVESLDIYPTLVALCGLRGAPAGLHGRSLARLLQNPETPSDRPAVSQVLRGSRDKRVMGYSLRTERYRYTFWAEGAEGEELYDYENDPRELRNLAAESSAAALKSRLRLTLSRICRARGIENAPGARAGGGRT